MIAFPKHNQKQAEYEALKEFEHDSPTNFLIHTNKVQAGTSSPAHRLPNMLQKRVERLGKAKAHNKLMVAHIGEALDRDEYMFGCCNPRTDKLHQRMSSCANWLEFRHYIEQDENRLTSANFCGKHLLCQACAVRRGALLLQKHHENIEHVLSEHDGLQAWMLTLTVKNGDDLSERFDHLQSAFKKLQKQRMNYLKKPDRNPFTEFAKIEGAVFSYEVPKSKDGESWHPHLHALIVGHEKPEMGHVEFVNGVYVPEKSHGLRYEFYKITGDSFMLDCRRKKRQPIIDMCMEVMKYAVKFSAQSVEDTWSAFQVLNGRRLFGSFGILRGVKIPANLLDEKLQGPYIEYVMAYLDGGHYEVERVTDCSELYDGYTSLNCSHSPVVGGSSPPTQKDMFDRMQL